MRIAYVAPFQGPTLLKRRPITGNLSLGTRAKIELIADLLQGNSHSVEILSQGEVIVSEWKAYPAFAEEERFNQHIPVYYASAFPVRFLNGFSSNLSLVRLLKQRHEVEPFDLVLIYNLKTPQVACANYVYRSLRVPVVLEYEDDCFRDIYPRKRFRRIGAWRTAMEHSKAKRLLDSLSGCLGGSSALLSQAAEGIPKLLLPGVVADPPSGSNGPRQNRVVFSGTHSRYQGLEQLVQAWRMGGFTGWELHIAGEGEMTTRLREIAQDDRSIVFRGMLNRVQNLEFLNSGKITVVAYDVSTTIGFSFKTLECLGAGVHVITTPLTALEALAPELKVALSYISDNRPETISACLKKVISERRYECTVQDAVHERYGPAAVSRSLATFLEQVMTGFRNKDSAERREASAMSTIAGR